jgi:alpha-beta hydrolase superfamily lysophospholipase
VPVLLLTGDDDSTGGTLRETGRVRDGLRRAGFTEVGMNVYAGCRSDILHDVCRSLLYGDVAAWLSSRN